MSIEAIAYYPDPMLDKAADPVTTFDEKTIELYTKLRDTAKAFNAEGLAATQIHVLYSAFVIKDHGTEDYIFCANPRILQRKGELDSTEGCLSFPGVYERVKRSEEIEVSYQDEVGAVVTRWFTGVNAVAFQHELDHLDGIVFLYHMGRLQKHLALKKLEKTRRKTLRQSKAIEAMMRKDLLKFTQKRLAPEKDPATI